MVQFKVHTENTTMASCMNGLLNQNIPMRVQVVHCEAVPVRWSARANVLKNTQNKCEEPCDCSYSVVPGFNSLTGRLANNVVLSEECDQSIKLLAVPIRPNLTHTPRQICFPSASIAGLNK